MKKLSAILCLLIAALPGIPAEAPQKPFDDIGAITRDLSAITGLKVLKPVPYDTLSREGLKEYIQKKIKAEVKPEEIRAEELALKKFGFVPQDFDLERTTVDLLTEQAAAFYDYRKKRLYVIDSNSDAMQEMALVHELAHALADQHFRLGRFIKKSESGDDRAMAHLAVMEGQATWLTFEFFSKRMGRSLKDNPDLARRMAGSMQSTDGQYPVLDKAPLYMRETLLFPYTQGMLFQNRLVEKMGTAGFSEVFRRPPLSTQQILHPEKYFRRVEPSSPKPPAFPESRGWRKLIEGSFGELEHALLLRQYGGKEAEALAAKWKGSSFLIVEKKDSAGSMLAYVSDWEDRDAARQFFREYRVVLKGKWKKFEVESESENKLAGRGDDGRFQVTLEGARVSSLEGLPNGKP
jgi:hypothetical protein